MGQIQNEARRRAERARWVGLFRYELIQEVVDPQLSARQRGALVRALAQGVHAGPFGEPVRISRPTIDRWVRWWRAGGFEALVPRPARVSARTPGRGARGGGAGSGRTPAAPPPRSPGSCAPSRGGRPGERTLQRHFVRLALTGDLARDVAPAPVAFGRFEATRCNELWVGDALHAPGHRRAQDLPVRVFG